jgi:uncharacterized membrane protein
MASDRFRQNLRQEARQWQVDGIISEDQYQQLASRYQFERLDIASRDRFVAILIGLGSILLGLGVTTFVAANWQAIPRDVRVMMLMSLFIGVSVSGFYLWRSGLVAQEHSWKQRLGHGLLIFGALILGANLALMGQLYHRGGSSYELFVIWGLAVVGMAYGLRLTSLSVLGNVLVGIGFWVAVRDFYDLTSLPSLKLILLNMPLVAGVVFLPLAYWVSSQAVFGLGAIAITSSLGVVFWQAVRDFGNGSAGILVAIALALPAAWLWSYSDQLWNRVFRRSDNLPTFQPIARALAMLYLTGLIYFLSFHWMWDPRQVVLPFGEQVSKTLPLVLNVNIIVVLLITLAQWVANLRSPRQPGRWRLDSTDGKVLVLISALAILTLWHLSIFPIQAFATYMLNVLLFLVAGSFVRDGIARGDRPKFWSGMGLLTLQILSRLLEYETGLLFKSLAFVLCGVGIIVLGLWFERHVRHLNPAQLESNP